MSEDYIDEVQVDIAPLDVCGVVFGIRYMYMMDEAFMRRENKYLLIRDGNSFIVNAHEGKYKNSLLSSNQSKYKFCIILFYERINH